MLSLNFRYIKIYFVSSWFIVLNSNRFFAAKGRSRSAPARWFSAEGTVRVSRRMFPLSRPEGSFYCTESVPEEPLEIKTFNSEDVERMSRWRNKEAEVRSCFSRSFCYHYLHLDLLYCIWQLFWWGKCSFQECWEFLLCHIMLHSYSYKILKVLQDCLE